LRYEIQLSGKPCSKKNRYTPRSDGKGFFKNTKLKADLDWLAIQIPGQYRDLKLVDPDITVQMYVMNYRMDRDNILVSMMDLLVQAGVLRNDNMADCNGTITIPPAIRSGSWQTIITLETK
jgi:Holliday junction resolvase RusA-like endonuclease